MTVYVESNFVLQLALLQELHAARAFAALGVEVVAGDFDDPSSLDRAFAGAYGAFCVTNFWEHFSVDREGIQATALARASRRAGLEHVLWSTLEDTRRWVPLDDSRLPTLQGRYKVPHFDSKGQVRCLRAKVRQARRSKNRRSPRMCPAVQVLHYRA